MTYVIIVGWFVVTAAILLYAPTYWRQRQHGRVDDLEAIVRNHRRKSH